MNGPDESTQRGVPARHDLVGEPAEGPGPFPEPATGEMLIAAPRRLPHFLKIDLGIIACTPLVPSTTWVTRKSTATLQSM